MWHQTKPKTGFCSKASDQPVDWFQSIDEVSQIASLNPINPGFERSPSLSIDLSTWSTSHQSSTFGFVKFVIDAQ